MYFRPFAFVLLSACTVTPQGGAPAGADRGDAPEGAGGEPVCARGERRCVGDVLEACAVDRLAWDVMITCEAGCAGDHCAVADPTPPAGAGEGEGEGEAELERPEAGVDCLAGGRRCVGSVAQGCDEGGRWQALAQCELTCDDGRCVDPVCAEGERRCVGDEVEECASDRGSWRFRRGCDTACVGGVCAAPACPAFARECLGSAPRACDARGVAWVEEGPCPDGCESGRCVAPAGAACAAGQARCDGLSRDVCGDEGAWARAEECAAACVAGACAECSPGQRRCGISDVEVCAADGSGWEVALPCEAGCVEGRCAACEPGARRCLGDVVEVCDERGRLWVSASVCFTSCLQGACTACPIGALACREGDLSRCADDGGDWEVALACDAGCADGECLADAGEGEGEADPGGFVCPPGVARCVGADSQVCAPDGSAWIPVQSCMDRCEAGSCVGPACLPFALSVTPERLRADGGATALAVSDVIRDVRGDAVPDGSVFTVEVSAGFVAAADGDPNRAGVQVRSADGRIDFAMRAPGEAGPVVVSAWHPVAGRCAGEASVEAEAEAAATVAVDFTRSDQRDASGDATWDVGLGRVDPFPSDFGDGRDGRLENLVSYNVNTQSQPWRVFPDAVNFVVTAIGDASVTVAGDVGGLEPGDDCLLINMQGDEANHDQVGVYEVLEVASVDFNADAVHFTTSIAEVYGVADNSDLAGQRIMLQRVPQYEDVVVRNTLQANPWDGERGGVLFFKARSQVTVHSRLYMYQAGYRRGRRQSGEGIAGYGPPDGQQFFGGGGGTDQDGSLSAGAGGAATAGDSADLQGGEVLGDAAFTRWIMGAGGGGGGNGSSGVHGGGLIVVWASRIAVPGSINAQSPSPPCCGDRDGGGGGGGGVYLRARTMNLGVDRVVADPHRQERGNDGGDGRVRLDYFVLDGRTLPAHHVGFAGGPVGRTGTLASPAVSIPGATLLSDLTRLDGGAVSYRLSADGGGEWVDAAVGDPVVFDSPGQDLRLQVIFDVRDPEPLTAKGVVIEVREP